MCPRQKPGTGSARFLQWALILLASISTGPLIASNPVKGATGFPINQGHSGAWYNPATSGQGVLFDIDPASRFLFGAIFTYESAAAAKLGAPEHRWLTLQGHYDGDSALLPIYLTAGGVFNEPVPTQTQAVGVASLRFDSCSQATLDYQLDGPPALSGSLALQRLLPGNEALCEQLHAQPGPVPDRIDPQQPVAFVDVAVLSMAEDDPATITHHQTVLVEDGVIIRMGPAGGVAIPSAALQIDGRGLLLSPGLTEMHLHVTTGGFQAARDAGLLLIANGVTTVLNMGDDLSINLQLIRDRFHDGGFLGPSLLAGNTAFGRGTGAQGQVITTRERATAYAEMLAARDYDYIKEYWFLEPPVLEQFEIESQRLGLPIIGHIPQTRPMATSLSRGQRMAAHIQEPYVTFLNFQTNPARIGAAAQVFLDNGTWLTPTLAVFDSYGRVYGGNAAQFQQLSQREGQQYTAAEVKAEWLRFYHSDIVQGSGQQPGGYDVLYAFFARMAREFHAAGVPLLVGTDAPGFPGVMSGFAVHEEMRLLREAGIPAADVLRAATRNAGEFVDATLAPETGFGWIAAGRRADLLLLDANPIEDPAALRRALAVMARGRLWSRTFLQAELDRLQARLGSQPTDAKALQALADQSHRCLDHLARP